MDGQKAVSDTGFKFDVILVRDERHLVARIEIESGDAFEYAFSLFRGLDRLAYRAYAPENVARFGTAVLSGRYYVKGYVRRRQGSQHPVSARSGYVSVPARSGTFTQKVRFSGVSTRPVSPLIAIENLILPQSNLTTAGEVEGTIQYRPRADVAPYEISLPFDWDTKRQTDRNWSAQLHMWRVGDHLLRQHEASGDPGKLHLFVAVMSDWHRYHLVEGKKSTYSWADQMVGQRAMRLAYVISRWQHGKLSLDQKTIAMLNSLVSAHLDVLLNPNSVKLSNHTWSDLHGVMALAQVVKDSTKEGISLLAAAVIRKLLPLQFNSEGVHLENSPAYHFYMIDYLKRLRRTGWFKNFGLAQTESKAMKVAEWLYLPDGRVAPIGDTNAAQQRDVSRPVFEGRNQAFNSSGYAIVRDDGGGRVSDASYLFFMGAFNGPFHKQGDDLSVAWFKGEDILCDAGKYAYQTDAYRTFFTSRRAHNTVMVDEWSKPNLPGAPYGSAIRRFERHPWGHLIEGSVDFSSIDVRHVRLCLHSVDGWLLLVDRLTGKADHRFVQLSHFSPEIGQFEPRRLGYDAQLSSGKRLAIRTAIGDRKLIRGQPLPDLQGWTSRSYGKVEPTFSLAIEQWGTEATFATLYSVDNPEAEVNMASSSKIDISLSASRRMEIRLDDAGNSVHAVEL